MNQHVARRDCFPRRLTQRNASSGFSSRSRAAFGFISMVFASVAAYGAIAVPADHAERMTKGLEAFDRDVRALLVDNCLNCHGGDKTKGDFSLADRDALLKGGADGPSVIPFDAQKSRLLKMLRHEEEPFMPEKKPRLSDEAIAKIEVWLEQGAP